MFAQSPPLLPPEEPGDRRSSFCPRCTLILSGSPLEPDVCARTCVCFLSRTYVLSCREKGTISGLFPPLCPALISSHLCSVCYLCHFRDPKRTPNSWGTAGVSSKTPGQAGAFFPQRSKEFLQYLKCEMQRLHNPHQTQQWEQEDCIASPANNSFVNILKYINKWFKWQLFYTGVYCFVLFYLINPLKWTHECDRLFSYKQKRRVSQKPVKIVMGRSFLFNLC